MLTKGLKIAKPDCLRIYLSKFDHQHHHRFSYLLLKPAGE